MPEHKRQIELTLETARPEVITRSDGDQHVAMEGFGVDSVPGAPKLPTLMCQVELPKDAEVLGLDMVDAEPMPIPGQFRIAAASPAVHDEPGDEDTRARARDAAQRAAERNQREIYRSNRWYPASPALLEGTDSTSSSVVALLRITPVRYKPVHGDLQWTPSVRVAVSYSLPEHAAEAFGDIAVTTTAQARINPFAPTTLAAIALAAPTPSPVDVAFNYLIIVPDAAIEQAMQRFVTWKESIGHSVIVERLPDILSSFSGADDAERVREFLIDRHRAWRIHYVLLVGTMGTLPARLLYMDDRTDAYASDFYFANLVTTDWDLDNDDRWGEFADDNYGRGYDVVVGRLPLDTVADVQRYCDNVIAFERDTGQWKRNALFAAGFMDFRPTDGAELCERLIDDVLTPAGWTPRTLYETGGTFQSQYSPDTALDQANYANECVARQYGLVTLVAHGDWDAMYAKQCTDAGRNCTGSNVVDNIYGRDGGIPASCPSAVVTMVGCSTACPVDSYKHVETQPGEPVVSPGRSLFPFTARHEHNGVRYLRHGAVAAIGASAGTDYASGWRGPSDGKSWSAAYYIEDELIAHGKPVGDAFSEGMYTYACRHPLLRGVRDLYLMGDPSLVTEGIGVLNPEGSDVLVHPGRWSHYAAYYDRNGDIYVVVSVGASAEPAEFLIYKSVDHGWSWALWHHIEGLPPIISLDAIVNHGGTDEFAYDDLLVFTTSLDDTIRVHTFPLAGGTHTTTTLANVGNLFNVLSVAHDNLHRGSRLYLGYCYYDSTAQPQSVVGVSYDNGRNWQHWERFSGYYVPTIDGGPHERVHVAAIRNNHTLDACVATSTDGGRSWGGWSNLTRFDGANDHYGSNPPAVVASTDPNTSAVWVSYERRYNGLAGPRRTELGLAYSTEQGQTWERNLTLAAGPGDTKHVQLAGYKPDPSPWVNSAYVSAQPTAVSSTNATVMRRALSGREPRSRRPATIFNHVEAVDHRPQLVYSPGASGTGGGTVFAGSGGVYFSAPWLTT